MQDRNSGNINEEKLRGMDLIQHLLDEERIAKLNERYLGLMEIVKTLAESSIDYELAELMKEFETDGIKCSTSSVITAKGNYYRFVFKNKFVILFPYNKEHFVRLCKKKSEMIRLKDIDEVNGDLYAVNRYRFQEVTREKIVDEDFFDFEAVIERIDDKMNKRIAAIKSRFLKCF